MALLRSSDIDDADSNPYLWGNCHIHAIAAAKLHNPDNMRFLVIEDHDEHVWDGEDEDDYIPAVIHVYSVHQINGQFIARDVLGDRLWDDALSECEDFYGFCEGSRTEVGYEDLLTYIQGNEEDYQRELGIEFPLSPIHEADIESALNEPTVTCGFEVALEVSSESDFHA